MTGAEHYQRAEQLLAEAALYPVSAEQAAMAAPKLAAAQVHATLALADAQRRATEALRKAN